MSERVSITLFVCVRASGGERVNVFRGRCMTVCEVCACPCAPPLCTYASVCVCVRMGGNEGGRGGGGGSSQTEAVDFTQHEDQSHSKPKGD